jgi:CMP-N-acetylneuraminic acid synthetase
VKIHVKKVNIIKIVAIIPARGGSKGIPRKNVKELNGKPLIGHILETALNVEEIDRVIVSTEDPEIQVVSKKFGAEVPFIRPLELAGDEVGTLPVLQHAVSYLEEKEGYKPDIIVLLYATSPLLSHSRISEAVRLIKEENFDSVISVIEDRGHYWRENQGKCERFYPKNPKNRQFTKPLFKENGAIYITKRDILMEKNEIVNGSIGFLVMEQRETVDIDELSDFEMVEIMMNKRVLV